MSYQASEVFSVAGLVLKQGSFVIPYDLKALEESDSCHLLCKWPRLISASLFKLPR